MIRIHFLNVGHGDCTIIEFPSGRLTVVDINVNQQFLVQEITEAAKELGWDASQAFQKSNGYWELTGAFKAAAGFSNLCDPLAYLDEHFPYQTIFRFIATHPHMDHLLGLADLVARRVISNFWYTAPGVDKPSFAESPYREEDWDVFQALASGTTQIHPISPKAGDTGNYWTDDGVEIWLPNQDIETLAEERNEPNLASYILAIRHGESLIVLGGDADEVLWEGLYNAWGGVYPKVAVLKAAHHGRRSGYHQPSVKAMSPELTVISVGKKPDTDASKLYAQYSSAVISTRYHGNIIVDCNDDGTWSYSSDRTRVDATALRQAYIDSAKGLLSRRLTRLTS